MNVGELKKALEGVPDDMPVKVFDWDFHYTSGDIADVYTSGHYVTLMPRRGDPQ